MKTSGNYGLKLFEGTDNVKRQDFVDNFASIDTQMKIINDNGYPSVTATGTNAYVGSTDRIKALGKGTKLTLFVGAGATGNSTLNLNSYGAKNIKDSFGNIVNNLKANIPYNLCYNGTDFILQGKGGGGNALPGEIIKSKTATTDAGPVVGTLDLSNLVTGNIKNGVTINGVSGKSTVVDTGDASLDPQYLLAGQSGYDDGVKKNGTLPNLGASQQAKDTWNSGTGELVFRIPSKGAFTDVIGGYLPQVYAWDSNYIADNIVSGKSIFGLWGNASVESLGGKKFASGSVTGASPIIVNIGWQPSIVITAHTDGIGKYIIHEKNQFGSYWLYPNTNNMFAETLLTITSTGFTLSNLNAISATVSYICIE